MRGFPPAALSLPNLFFFLYSTQTGDWHLCDQCLSTLDVCVLSREGVGKSTKVKPS